MKCAKKFFVIFFFLKIGFLSFCQTFDFQGKLITEGACALPYTENAFDFLLAQTSLDSQLSFYAGNNNLFVRTSLSYNALESAQSEIALQRIFGKESYLFRLKEAYYSYEDAWFSVRVGRQSASWGVADGITVSDVLCPKDQTNLFASDFSESSLAIDAVKVSLFTSSLILDAYWIPFFTPAILPSQTESVTVDLPELTLSNAEYAIRMSGYFSFADFSLYGFYGWDDIPILKYELSAETPPSVTVSGEYKRVLMFALDSSIPIGQVTARVEAAFFPMRYFSKSVTSQLSQSDSAFQQNNQLVSLLGLDWLHGDLTLTAQYYADFVFGELSNLDRDFFTHLVTLQGSYSLLGGNLSLSLGGIVHLVDFDSAIQAQVDYSLTDNLSLSCATNFFVPGIDEKGSFSSYKDLSCIVFKGVLRF